MKTIKRITAAVAAVVMAGAMSISAFATDYKDAVQAAKDAGTQAHNVQQLQNFLEAHPTYFTSAQYDDMIADLNNIRDTYVKPKMAELGLTGEPGALSEADKEKIGRAWTQAERDAIIKDLKDLGAKYKVTVTVERSTQNVGYDVSAKIDEEVNPQPDPVVPTGTETESANTAAVFGAAAAIVLAGAGIVVVAKKNKEN